MVRGFQGDAADVAVAEVGQGVFGRFLVIDASAAQQCAAPAPYPFQPLFVTPMAAFVFVGLIAFLQLRQVVAAQVIDEFEGDGFFIQCVAADRAAGGQVVTALFHDDFRPQHAGGVVEPEIVGKEQALFGFGNTGFVAGFGRFFAQHTVNQGGFAYVGNATNHDAQGFVHAFAVRHEGAAGGNQLLCRLPVGSVQRDGVGVRAGLEFGQPQGGALGVGQILFVEDFQFGFVRREFAQQGVFAGCGHARVQHFYHHIDAFKPFDNRFFGLVHMAGIPLDCHVFRFSVLNMGKAV